MAQVATVPFDCNYHCQFVTIAKWNQNLQLLNYQFDADVPGILKPVTQQPPRHITFTQKQPHVPSATISFPIAIIFVTSFRRRP